MALFRVFSTLGCPTATLDDALVLAQTSGLAGVELRSLGGSVDLPLYLAQQFETPAALAEKMRSSPLKIVAFGTSLRLMGGATEEREKLLEFVPWAEALGVPRLRVFDGGKTANEAEISQAADTLEWWKELRARRGWKVDWMVETHDSLLTAATIARLLQRVPGTAILWDAHHTWRKGGEDPLATWPAIREAVVHVHVKDSINVPSARHPFTYVLPGAGEFPARPLLTLLRSAGFRGPVSLEWELLWHPYLPPLTDALRIAQSSGWW